MKRLVVQNKLRLLQNIIILQMYPNNSITNKEIKEMLTKDNLIWLSLAWVTFNNLLRVKIFKIFCKILHLLPSIT